MAGLSIWKERSCLKHYRSTRHLFREAYTGWNGSKFV